MNKETLLIDHRQTTEFAIVYPSYSVTSPVILSNFNKDWIKYFSFTEPKHPRAKPYYLSLRLE